MISGFLRQWSDQLCGLTPWAFMGNDVRSYPLRPPFQTEPVPENAVSGRLDNVTVVAMDSVDHELERRVDNRSRLFGIEFLHQIHRSLDVGEQRRHRLALALGDVKAGLLWNRLRRECRLFRADRPLGRWFSGA